MYARRSCSAALLLLLLLGGVARAEEGSDQGADVVRIIKSIGIQAGNERVTEALKVLEEEGFLANVGEALSDDGAAEPGAPMTFRAAPASGIRVRPRGAGKPTATQLGPRLRKPGDPLPPAPPPTPVLTKRMAQIRAMEAAKKGGLINKGEIDPGRFSEGHSDTGKLTWNVSWDKWGAQIVVDPFTGKATQWWAHGSGGLF